MIEVKSKYLLWLAGAIMLSADLVCSEIIKFEWCRLPFNLYYSSVALSIYMFHRFIYVNFKKYFIAFLTYGLSINKLSDELFFCPTKLQLNELLFAFILLIIGFFKYGGKDRLRRIYEKLHKIYSHDRNSNNSSRSKTYSGE